MKLRPATNQDFDSIFKLIENAYLKFGDRVWLQGQDSDITDIEGNYPNQGGAFVVLEQKRKIIGTHAVRPINIQEGLITFRRLYLKPEYHGSKASHLLFQWAIDWAREHTFKRIEFWSDTRFERAHSFFQKFGFSKTGDIQHIHDAPDPYSEYLFFLDLSSGE